MIAESIIIYFQTSPLVSFFFGGKFLTIVRDDDEKLRPLNKSYVNITLVIEVKDEEVVHNPSIVVLRFWNPPIEF